jgi:hypothetical protein
MLADPTPLLDNEADANADPREGVSGAAAAARPAPSEVAAAGVRLLATTPTLLDEFACMCMASREEWDKRVLTTAAPVRSAEARRDNRLLRGTQLDNVVKTV